MKRKEKIVYNYFNETNNYLHKNFGIIVRKKILNDILGPQKNKNILDVGCGDGSVSVEYGDDNKLSLLDQSEKMLSLAKNNAALFNVRNIDLFNCSLKDFSPKKKYDVIILFGFLAHVDSLSNTFNKIHSLLNNNGKILIQYSDHKKLITKINMYFSDKIYIKNRITDNVIDQILKELGLKVRKKVRYSILPPGIGILPNQLLHHITLATYKNNLLSRFGTEVICEIKAN